MLLSLVEAQLVLGQCQECVGPSESAEWCSERYCVRHLVLIANFPSTFFSYRSYKSSAADSLLAERGRIDSSHQMTDEILECASSHISICNVNLYLSLTGKPMKRVQNSVDSDHHLLESILGWVPSSVSTTPACVFRR